MQMLIRIHQRHALLWRLGTSHYNVQTHYLLIMHVCTYILVLPVCICLTKCMCVCLCVCGGGATKMKNANSETFFEMFNSGLLRVQIHLRLFMKIKSVRVLTSARYIVNMHEIVSIIRDVTNSLIRAVRDGDKSNFCSCAF